MSHWKTDIRQMARELSRAPQIRPEEIPDLDIYMDQLTTYLDKRLGFYNREAEAPFITRSMVNNYSKAKLLPPPVSKRYSRVHIMALSLICQLKRLFTIQDLGRLLDPAAGEAETETLYRLFLDTQREVFAETPEAADALLAELEEEAEDGARREKAALVAQLAVRAQRDLLLAERILDTMETEAERERREKKQKKQRGEAAPG